MTDCFDPACYSLSLCCWCFTTSLTVAFGMSTRIRARLFSPQVREVSNTPTIAVITNTATLALVTRDAATAAATGATCTFAGGIDP